MPLDWYTCICMHVILLFHVLFDQLINGLVSSEVGKGSMSKSACCIIKHMYARVHNTIHYKIPYIRQVKERKNNQP